MDAKPAIPLGTRGTSADLVAEALRKLPDAPALARYRELDGIFDSVIRSIQAATHRNLVVSAHRSLGLNTAEFVAMGDEAAIVLEYAAFRERKRGRTTIERMLTKHSTPGPETDAGRMLRAMAEARFSAGRITEVREGLGIVLFDFLRCDALPIICPELATPEHLGVFISTRTFELEGFTIITGAPNYLLDETVDEIIRNLNPDEAQLNAGYLNGFELTPEEEAEVEREILTSHINYLFA
jgi:hypothetical protein